MRKLYSADISQGPLLWTLKGLLDEADIASTVRGEHFVSVAGGIPFTETHPELWVLNESDYPRASRVLAEWLSASSGNHSAWTCSKCGETSEPQFGECWNCGAQSA